MISADGSRVAAYYGPEYQAWNVETGEKLPGMPTGRFAPDGTLMTWGGGMILLYDVDRDKRIGTLSDKPHRMGTVAFTPDGKLMANARYGESTEVVVWDFAKREVIRVLRGVRGGIAALCFSPDGRTLCASDRSTRIVVWDLSND